MKQLHSQTEGFTVIELLVFIAVLVVVAVVGISNFRGLKASNRDAIRKSNINAIYYQLESFHEKNNYYPQKIDAKVLKGIDPDNLRDVEGVEINTSGSEYSYKPISCNDSKCKSYVLTAQLEKEAPFTKESLSK